MGHIGVTRSRGAGGDGDDDDDDDGETQYLDERRNSDSDLRSVGVHTEYLTLRCGCVSPVPNGRG